MQRFHMNKWLVSLLASFSLLMFFSGCVQATSQNPAVSEQQVIIQKVDREDIREVIKEERLMYIAAYADKTLTATGEGIAPMNTISPAQALALAKRAAMADAYRQLGAKLYGVRISAKDTVQDAALQNSRIIAQVDGIIKDAAVTQYDYKDGLYRVTMEVKMSEARWQEIFAY